MRTGFIIDLYVDVFRSISVGARLDEEVAAQ